MSDVEQQGPARRASDARIEALEKSLAENTRLTSENTQQIQALHGTVVQIKTGNDALLQMKELVEGHIGVLCTWARWTRRAIYAVGGLAGTILPVLVAARELGWF